MKLYDIELGFSSKEDFTQSKYLAQLILPAKNVRFSHQDRIVALVNVEAIPRLVISYYSAIVEKYKFTVKSIGMSGYEDKFELDPPFELGGIFTDVSNIVGCGVEWLNKQVMECYEDGRISVSVNDTGLAIYLAYLCHRRATECVMFDFGENSVDAEDFKKSVCLTIPNCRTSEKNGEYTVFVKGISDVPRELISVMTQYWEGIKGVSVYINGQRMGHISIPFWDSQAIREFEDSVDLLNEYLYNSLSKFRVLDSDINIELNKEGFLAYLVYRAVTQ